MNHPWPVYALEVLCALFAAASALGQTHPVALPSAAAEIKTSETTSDVPVNIYSEEDIPPGIRELMSCAQLKFQEGSRLVQSGDAAGARAAYNAAIDIVTKSEYDLTSTPLLNGFFEDLIRQIQQEEARYLPSPYETGEKQEGAVVDELDEIDLIPITVDPSLQDTVVSDLLDTSYDIPVVLNEKVVKALDYWLTKGRKLFSDGLVRSGRYRDMIERIFHEESIPLDVMYLAMVESLFKPNAVSRARARGIWQFEKGTAIRYGLKINSYVDERSDPEKSTRAAARYLSDLYDMFKDWNLVLAAYNWGEGKVQRLMQRSGLDDFWEMSSLRRRNFPRETKNHVPLILASIILARNPDKYGLPKELDAALTYDRVKVGKAIDLRSAARLLDMPVDGLKELNPALRGLSTPANYPEFQLKVPAGMDWEVLQKIAELPRVKFRPSADFEGKYRIKQGDTLSWIAACYQVSVAALERANPGVNPRSLRIGSSIWVPGAHTATGASSRAVSSTVAKEAGKQGDLR